MKNKCAQAVHAPLHLTQNSFIHPKKIWYLDNNCGVVEIKHFPNWTAKMGPKDWKCVWWDRTRLPVSCWCRWRRFVAASTTTVKYGMVLIGWSNRKCASYSHQFPSLINFKSLRHSSHCCTSIHLHTLGQIIRRSAQQFFVKCLRFDFAFIVFFFVCNSLSIIHPFRRKWCFRKHPHSDEVKMAEMRK